MKFFHLYATALSFIVLCSVLVSCDYSNTKSLSSNLSGTVKESQVKNGSAAGSDASSALPAQEYKLMNDGTGITCNDITSLTDGVLDTLKKAGIEYIKIHVPYPFEPNGTSITTNYLHAKLAIKKIKDHGMNVLAQSFTPGGKRYDSKTGTIGWFSNLPNVYSSFDDEYFYKISRAGCEYIARDLKDYTTHWLVSNEPDIDVFTGSMTPDQISSYILACAEGLDKGNPGVKTGVNMFVSVNPAYSLQLVKKLYKKGSPLDFLGLDSYFGTLVEGSPESWANYIDQFSAAADAPILITEWAYSSAVYDPSLVKSASGLKYNSDVCRLKKFSFNWEGHERNQATQAEYVTACMKIFAEHPAVIGSFWFCIQDYDGPCWECGEVKCPMNSEWGVLKSDNTAKPALDAYTKAVHEFYKK